MGVFVDAQNKALAGMLSQYRGSKSRSSLEASASNRSSQDDDSAAHALVLPSSTELFYFYAQNLDQCAKLFEKPEVPEDFYKDALRMISKCALLLRKKVNRGWINRNGVEKVNKAKGILENKIGNS